MARIAHHPRPRSSRPFDPPSAAEFRQDSAIFYWNFVENVPFSLLRWKKVGKWGRFEAIRGDEMLEYLHFRWNDSHSIASFDSARFCNFLRVIKKLAIALEMANGRIMNGWWVDRLSYWFQTQFLLEARIYHRWCSEIWAAFEPFNFLIQVAEKRKRRRLWPLNRRRANGKCFLSNTSTWCDSISAFMGHFPHSECNLLIKGIEIDLLRKGPEFMDSKT